MHEQIDMSELFDKYPTLREVEGNLDNRFERRRPILNQIPKWSRGAEIGVFTGTFSEFLLQVAKPKVFYAVDPWFTLYGDNFPNWGEYSANGRLKTRAGYEATVHRLKRFPGTTVVAQAALEWLDTLPPDSLDWAYLDSTHQYDPTVAELNGLMKKLNPNGILLGDDCWARRDSHRYSLFRAVRDFCRTNNFEIIQMDNAGQWAARRSID